MGNYLNPGIRKFQMSLNSKIYVDKSILIEETNAVFATEQRFICISRPRRFGKTMAVNMLAAYYGAGEDANPLFKNLTIANHPSYREHLNKYNVIMVNMQEFLSETELESLGKKLPVAQMISKLQTTIIDEIVKANPETEYNNLNDFIQIMHDTYQATKCPFVILIDSWDCIFRVHKNDIEAQKDYLDFLRLWLKDQDYVGLAYMTGILPIKKLCTYSGLNMFVEYSMIDSGRFKEYFGFTGDEVTELCKKYNVDVMDVKEWYNGYFIYSKTTILNPVSVVEYLNRNEIANYWNRTETRDVLQEYINLNFVGLKEKITMIVIGGDVSIDTRSFENDMTTFNSADDVLTLLVHLGYLSYNCENESVRVPNEEVKCEFVDSIENIEKWNVVAKAIKSVRRSLC